MVMAAAEGIGDEPSAPADPRGVVVELLSLGVSGCGFGIVCVEHASHIVLDFVDRKIVAPRVPASRYASRMQGEMAQAGILDILNTDSGEGGEALVTLVQPVPVLVRSDGAPTDGRQTRLIKVGEFFLAGLVVGHTVVMGTATPVRAPESKMPPPSCRLSIPAVRAFPRRL